MNNLFDEFQDQELVEYDWGFTHDIGISIVAFGITAAAFYAFYSCSNNE